MDHVHELPFLGAREDAQHNGQTLIFIHSLDGSFLEPAELNLPFLQGFWELLEGGRPCKHPDGPGLLDYALDGSRVEVSVELPPRFHTCSIVVRLDHAQGVSSRVGLKEQS